MQEQAIVRRVDHLVVRVNPAEPLFKILTQQLLLPQAWPITTNPFYTSGAVHLSNLNLELMQIGASQQAAHLYGIAFELEPYEISLPLLNNRNIPHTPPMPFFVVDDQGWQMTAWTNIFLGGLLSSRPTSRMFFELSKRAPKERWENSSLPTTFNRRFGLPFIYENVYRSAITYSVEYNPVWRAAHIVQNPNGAGLDVQRVFEVTIGVRDYENAHACWSALLNPHVEITTGVWQMPDGMYLRLIQREHEGLKRMIWQVASLNRAAQFLNKREMLGEEKDGMITIAEQTVDGLDIRLVQ